MQRLEKIFTDYKDYLLLDNYYMKDLDTLVLYMKDLKGDNNQYIRLKNPKCPVYILKPEYIKKNERLEYAPIEWTEKHYVPYAYRQWNIAQLLNINNFNDLIKAGRLVPNDIFLHKRLFYADALIEDLVVREYVNAHTTIDEDGNFHTDIPIMNNLHISAYDIESEIKKTDNMEEQEINAYTYIDDKFKVSETIALINPEYKGQEAIMKDIPGFTNRMIEVFHKLFDGCTLTDPKRRKMVQEKGHALVDALKFNIEFTHDEKYMIEGINYKIINVYRPEFALAYNMMYDLSQQKHRSDRLGIDYNKMFTTEGLEPYVDFQLYDNNPEFNKREHHCYNNSPTKFGDPMLFYYQIRSTTKFFQHSLDATAERELGIHKLNFKELGINYIGDLPYDNYEFFLMYNIFDVLLLILLEQIIQDVFSRIYTRFTTCVEYSGINRSLRRTTGAFDNYAYLQGLLPACEINKVYLKFSEERIESLKEKDPATYRFIRDLHTEKVVQGGLCSNPNRIHPSVKGTDVYGITVSGYSKFSISADNDATSMYPNNLIANNATKGSLIGTIHNIENIEMNQDTAHKFAMSIINKNIMSLGNMLFNVPNGDYIEEHVLGITKKIKTNINNKYNDKDTEITLDKKQKEVITMLTNMNKYRFHKDDDKLNLPTVNKCFLLSDSNETKISYYGTKVTIKIDEDKTFNGLMGIEGNGITYGRYFQKENKIQSYLKEYVEYLIPKETDFNIEFIKEYDLTETQIDKIEKAKIRPYDLMLDDIKITMLNNTLFMNLDYVKKNNIGIKCTISNIKEDKNLRHVKFVHTIPLSLTNLEVTQEMVIYAIKPVA